MTPELRSFVFARALQAYEVMLAAREAFVASPTPKMDRAYTRARKAWNVARFSAEAIEPGWHPANPESVKP